MYKLGINRLGKPLTRSTWYPFNANPPEAEHRRVMVYMQECQLFILLPQNEKECITEF